MKRMALAAVGLTAAVVVVWALGGSSADAQEKDDRGVCREDVSKLCGEVEPGQGRILACLEGSKDQLSADCKARVDKMSSRRDAAQKACQADADRLCAGLEIGAGLGQCLKEHETELSADCAEQVKAIGKDIRRGKAGKGGKRSGFGAVCKADVESFCQGVEPGQGRIAACMKEHQAELSADCKAHVEKQLAFHDAATAACGSDAASLCAGIEPGKGLMRCLDENRAKVSEGCAAFVDEWSADHPNAGKGKRGKGAKGAKNDLAKKARQACQADIDSHCAGVEPGEGRLRDCLQANSGALSDDCRSAIEKAETKSEKKAGKKAGKGDKKGGKGGKKGGKAK